MGTQLSARRKEAGGRLAKGIEVELEERPAVVDALLRANAFFNFSVLYEAERKRSESDEPEIDTAVESTEEEPATAG